MAIETSIRLNDGMSKTMQTMLKNIDRIINSLKTVNGVDMKGLEVAQNSISKATSNLVRQQNDFQRELVESNEKMTQLGNNGANQTNKLTSMFKRAAVALGGMYVVKQGLDLADNVINMNARLNIAKDPGQTTEELRKQIYQMSQMSRGDFMVNVDAVAKFKLQAGHSFNNNNEIIKFQELLNKQMAISGTSQIGKESVMLQLTQAMSAGVLRGEELNAVLDNAAPLARLIEAEMGIAEGSIKSVAEKGLISADIVKNALLNSADSINAQFNSMPMTFGQAMAKMKNEFVMNFQPVADSVAKIVNSDSFQNSISVIGKTLGGLIVVVAGVVSAVGLMGSVIANNFNMIIPIIAIATAGLIAYKWAVISSILATKSKAISEWATATAIAAKNTVLMIAATLTALVTGATIAQTAAQYGLNAALYACPLVWIVVTIIAVIAVIYLVVAALNKWAGTTYSATGLIVGAVMALGAFLTNILIGIINLIVVFCDGIYNRFAFIAETMVNMFINPGQTLKRLFYDIGIYIIEQLSNIASFIDKILGTDYSTKLNEFSTKLQNVANEKYGEKEFKIERRASAQVNYLSPTNAFDKGNKWGTGLGNKMASMKNNLGFDDSKMTGLLSGIEKNTAATSKGLDLTTEEIKYMRDIAEQEIINRYTTATVTNQNHFQNTINNSMDMDNVVSEFASGMHKASEMVANGKY